MFSYAIFSLFFNLNGIVSLKGRKVSLRCVTNINVLDLSNNKTGNMSEGNPCRINVLLFV